MNLIRTANIFSLAARPTKGVGWLVWRAQLLTCSLWCGLIFGGIAYWSCLYISNIDIETTTLMVMIVGYLWLLSVAVFTKFPYSLRAISLLLLILGAGWVLVFYSTMPVIGIIFLSSFIVLSGLLVSWPAAVAAIFLFIGALTTALYLSLPLPSIFVTPIVPMSQVDLLLYAGLSLTAAAVTIIPLALHLSGSSRAFNQRYELLQEAGQQKTQYQQMLGQITRDYDTHLLQGKALSEMIALLGTTHNQSQLLKSALNLIMGCYGYQRAEIYLQADNSSFTHAVQFIDENGLSNQYSGTVSVDRAPEIIRQTMAGSQPQQAMVEWVTLAGSDVESMNYTTTCIPISYGKQVIGALLISKHLGADFSNTEIAGLITYNQLLAFGVLNLQLSMSGQLQPGNISSVNQAIQLITQADTREQILVLLGNAFKISTFPAIQFSAEKEIMRLVSVHDPDKSSANDWSPMSFSLESIENLVASGTYLPFDLQEHPNLPDELATLLLKLGWASAAFIPVQQNGRLNTLFILGSHISAELTSLSLQPYVSLAGYATTTLEKVIATSHLQRRVAALQSLATISQSISVVTELEELFDSVHEQITQVIGEVDLAIALYDQNTELISIPYAHEAGEKLTIEPFPLGQGLTSILIHSQQPLMIVEDTERKALELGAKVAGASAKSWLGVPLIVTGEILGAIILQDTVREHRFDEDDMRLMTTLASQVAITIRNIRLLQDAKQRAERERIISNITTRIWAAPDVESVTRTALQELGRALRASSGKIRLEKHITDYPSGEIPEEERMTRH